MIERRRYIRSAVRLWCRIEMNSYTLTAEVIELSPAGARLFLPIAGDSAELWRTAILQIADIDRIEARMEWQSGNIVGVSFPKESKSLLKYLDGTRR